MSYVESFDNIWVRPLNSKDHVGRLEELTSEMTRFYTAGAGTEWAIPDSNGDHLKSVMAVKLGDKFYRVTVVKVWSADVVNIFYVDYGNTEDVFATDLRLLHKDFVDLPAQAISVRLWGIQEPMGRAAESRLELKSKLSDGNYYGFSCTKVRVKDGPRRRWSGGVEENGQRPAVILQDVRDGSSISFKLLMENQATLDLRDYSVGNLGCSDMITRLNDSKEKVEYCRKLQTAIKGAWEALIKRGDTEIEISRPKLSQRNSTALDCKPKVKIIEIEDSDNSDDDEEILEFRREVERIPEVTVSRPKLKMRGGSKMIIPSQLGSQENGNKVNSHRAPPGSRVSSDDEEDLKDIELRIDLKIFRPKLRKQVVTNLSIITSPGPGSEGEDSGVYDEEVEDILQKRRVCDFIKAGPCYSKYG